MPDIEIASPRPFMLMKELKFGTKMVQAMNRQLDVSFELTQEITELSTDLLTLSRVLGIFLDNAIEAASETEQKRFHIAIVCKGILLFFILKTRRSRFFSLWKSFSSQVFLPKKRTAVLDFPPQIC